MQTDLGRRDRGRTRRPAPQPAADVQVLAGRKALKGAQLAALAAAVLCAAPAVAETWRGLAVAPEHRCSPYDRGTQYPYSGRVEARIVERMGGRVYGPYTGTTFATTRQTDIEHVVATSEAHDSGLCAADAATRRRFASDLANLTLASPRVNRGEKGGRDAGEWLPRMNRCWFAGRVVEVKRKYGLSVDPREASALEGVLSGCASTEMVVGEGPAPATGPTPGATATGAVDALRRWDTNGNGRITCEEARQHRIAPVRREHPAYRFMRDRDRDGVVCE